MKNNNVKHTPRPWTVREQKDVLDKNTTNYEFLIISEPEFSKSKGFEGIVLKFDCFNGFENEGRANARLIAAAPELLEALNGILKTFRTCIGNEAFNDFVLGNNEVIAAFTAIAKATGSSEE